MTYTQEQIDEQLGAAKRCKTFVDFLNGETPCLGITEDFLEGALGVALSAAVRLGEIVELQRAEIERLTNEKKLVEEEMAVLMREMRELEKQINISPNAALTKVHYA